MNLVNLAYENYCHRNDAFPLELANLLRCLTELVDPLITGTRTMADFDERWEVVQMAAAQRLENEKAEISATQQSSATARSREVADNERMEEDDADEGEGQDSKDAEGEDEEEDDGMTPRKGEYYLSVYDYRGQKIGDVRTFTGGSGHNIAQSDTE